jgi:hypothetical protein
VSSTTTVPPYLFEAPGTHDAPFTFAVPASLEVMPYTAHATFDGTGASGDFRPCLTFLGVDGVVLGRYFPADVVKQGDVQEVTYTPPFGTAPVSSASGGASVAGRYTFFEMIAPSTPTEVTWVFDSGTPLFDLTAPKFPVPLVDGNYVLTVAAGTFSIQAGKTQAMSLVAEGSSSLSVETPWTPVPGLGGATNDFVASGWPLTTGNDLYVVIEHNLTITVSYTGSITALKLV